MFHLDTLSTLVAATLVLLLGRKLVQTVPFLRNTPFLNPLPAVCWWRWRCWC
jgi:ESS family glutamate:Na+ symporter